MFRRRPQRGRVDKCDHRGPRIIKNVKPGAYERHAAIHNSRVTADMEREEAEWDEYFGSSSRPEEAGTMSLPCFRSGRFVIRRPFDSDGPPPVTGRRLGNRRVGARDFDLPACIGRVNDPCRSAITEREKEVAFMTAKIGLQFRRPS